MDVDCLMFLSIRVLHDSCEAQGSNVHVDGLSYVNISQPRS